MMSFAILLSCATLGVDPAPAKASKPAPAAAAATKVVSTDSGAGYRAVIRSTIERRKAFRDRHRGGADRQRQGLEGGGLRELPDGQALMGGNGGAGTSAGARIGSLTPLDSDAWGDADTLATNALPPGLGNADAFGSPASMGNFGSPAFAADIGLPGLWGF